MRTCHQYIYIDPIIYSDNAEDSGQRKQTRNEFLGIFEDIRESGYSCNNIPFEVGSRVHIPQANRSNFASMHKIAKLKTSLKNFLTMVSKISLLLLLFLSTFQEIREDGLAHHPSVLTNNVAGNM